MPAVQQDDEPGGGNSAPTGFKVALDNLDKLDKTKKAVLFWAALALFASPPTMVAVIVVADIWVDPTPPGWLPYILAATFLVGGLMLMPHRTLKALDRIGHYAIKLSPKLGAIFQSKDRHGGDDASKPNSPGASKP